MDAVYENPFCMKNILILLAVFLTILLLISLGVFPLAWSVIIPLLIWTAITDIKIRIIPNTVPVVLILLGLYLDPAAAIVGFFGCCLCLLPLYVFNGMGGGDLKLAASIGAAIGYIGGISIIFYSSFLALIYIIITKLAKREIREYIRDTIFAIRTFGLKYEMPENLDELIKVTVPLGAFFLPGALIFLIKGGMWLV